MAESYTGRFLAGCRHPCRHVVCRANALPHCAVESLANNSPQGLKARAGECQHPHGRAPLDAALRPHAALVAVTSENILGSDSGGNSTCQAAFKAQSINARYVPTGHVSPKHPRHSERKATLTSKRSISMRMTNDTADRGGKPQKSQPTRNDQRKRRAVPDEANRKRFEQ